MKFTLTYDGELRSNSGPRPKSDIRRHIHPQLQELWEIDPSLKSISQNRFLPSGGYFPIEIHHSIDEPRPPNRDENSIDLCAPIQRGGRAFLPLVRDSFLLKCGLKILFLRKESPGRIYQGGDLDNRLKTLFDALAVPSGEQVVDDPSIEGPIYTLLEDDRLITSVEVDTHRLLSRPGASEHEVRLVIEVDVRVIRPRTYNQPFLGG